MGLLVKNSVAKRIDEVGSTDFRASVYPQNVSKRRQDSHIELVSL